MNFVPPNLPPAGPIRYSPAAGNWGGLLYSMLGEPDRAIDLPDILLQRAGIDTKIWFKKDSYFDPFRSHPHYQMLLKLAGKKVMRAK